MLDPISTADLREALRRGTAHCIYEGVEGTLLLSADETLLMSDVQDGAFLCKMIRSLCPTPPEIFGLKSRDAAQAVLAAFERSGCEYCTQWVYEKTTPPLPSTADIRPLSQAHADLAAAVYHDEDGYIHERIEQHALYGLFEGDTLAGFAGFHMEGSMGMLEILPEFRLRGYAMQLESFLIGTALDEGRVPYCHVIDGNEASLRLQRKMGLTCAAFPTIWVG